MDINCTIVYMLQGMCETREFVSNITINSNATKTRVKNLVNVSMMIRSSYSSFSLIQLIALKSLLWWFFHASCLTYPLHVLV